MISNAQIALLHVAQHDLGLDRETYKAILREQAGVESSTDLDKRGFEKVLKRFEELGFQQLSPKKKRFHRPSDPITRFQQEKVRGLYAKLGWTELHRQMAFNRRQCGKSWPQTRLDAAKVIEGLKAIIKRNRSHTLGGR